MLISMRYVQVDAAAEPRCRLAGSLNRFIQTSHFASTARFSFFVPIFVAAWQSHGATQLSNCAGASFSAGGVEKCLSALHHRLAEQLRASAVPVTGTLCISKVTQTGRAN